MEIAFLVGRILFGGYFVLAGINHLVKNQYLAGYAASKGVPMPRVGVIVSGLLALVGGLSLAFGYMPFIGIIALLVFMIPVTFFMHAFWKVAGIDTDAGRAHKMSERISFEKNLAIIGALLMFLAISVPWVWAL